MLERRKLGDSELEVPVLGIGCNQFGHNLDAAATARVVHAALDAGVDFFDTADVYSRGESESHLGEALKGRRDRALIATKFGGSAYPDHPEWRGGSRKHVRFACENSLRRLGTDYLDLYQMHMPDPAVPIEETLEELDALVREGKVRHLGNSNFAGWQVADADWTSRTKGFAGFISAQNRYSLLERGVEGGLVPALQRFSLGMLPYQPLAGGLLTGKYRRGVEPPAGVRLAGNPRAAAVLTDANFDVVERLEAFAVERGATPLAVAIGWLAAQPSVASVLVGATSPEQVAANAQAVSWRPSKEDSEELDRLTR